ncbi:hypothetical protein [Streptococcus loxodontisalivarius]|uniref:Membrane protein n=1 Tax=Streptococcus loxodontisalivarius TaxID=1349415 RepID=A0ABS2PSL8_9STRE|nr:hypothetical protein [Streptococcus loxodontisalivarius]MBM7642499.1 putative membrane protein [Streptococcus loxodontisalivarius]
MKRTVYLYILLATSVIATLSRVFSSFFSGQPETIQSSEYISSDMATYLNELAKVQYAYSTGVFYRSLVILMVIALLASLFYLLRKDLKAVFIYLFYLGLTFIESLLALVHNLTWAPSLSSGLESGVATSAASSWLAFAFSLLLLAIYLLVIYLNRNSRAIKKAKKAKSSMDL